MTDFATEFTAAFESFLDKAQAKVDKARNDGHPAIPRTVLTFQPGRKYARVVETRNTRVESSFCFVDLTNGDVLKCDGWKKPAKHARGNIFNPDNGAGAVNGYGANYLG